MSKSQTRPSDVWGTTLTIGDKEVVDRETNVCGKSVKTKTLMVCDIRQRNQNCGVTIQRPIPIEMPCIARAFFGSTVPYSPSDPLVLDPSFWYRDFASSGPLILNTVSETPSATNLIVIPEASEFVSDTTLLPNAVVVQVLASLSVNLQDFEDFEPNLYLQKLQLVKNNDQIVGETVWLNLLYFESITSLQINTMVVVQPGETLDLVFTSQGDENTKVTLLGDLGSSISVKLVSFIEQPL